MQRVGYDDLHLDGDKFCPWNALAINAIAEEQRCPLSDGRGTLP